MFYHRKKFVFEGYHSGVIEFVNESWELIHRAAGWGALRTFLLVSS